MTDKPSHVADRFGAARADPGLANRPTSQRMAGVTAPLSYDILAWKVGPPGIDRLAEWPRVLKSEPRGG